MTELADQHFSLRPILVSAFGPALMFGVAEGAVLPVVALVCCVVVIVFRPRDVLAGSMSEAPADAGVTAEPRLAASA